MHSTSSIPSAWSHPQSSLQQNTILPRLGKSGARLPLVPHITQLQTHLVTQISTATMKSSTEDPHHPHQQALSGQTHQSLPMQGRHSETKRRPEGHSSSSLNPAWLKCWNHTYCNACTLMCQHGRLGAAPESWESQSGPLHLYHGRILKLLIILISLRVGLHQ